VSKYVDPNFANIDVLFTMAKSLCASKSDYAEPNYSIETGERLGI